MYKRAIGLAAALALMGGLLTGCTFTGTVKCTQDSKGITTCKATQAPTGSPSTAPPSATATPTPSVSPTPTPSATSPTLTQTATPTASATPSSTATPTPTATPTGSLSNLARVPWDGGNSFYKKFAIADQAGWDDPSFFPIGVWYASANPTQMQYDKAHGINFYVQFNPESGSKDFENQGMWSWSKPWDAPAGAWKMQPGDYLDDEVDGRFGWDEGVAYMNKLATDSKAHAEGRFTYANWTPSLISYDAPMSITTRYWNTVDVSSTSNYYYSGKCFDWRLRTPAGYNDTTLDTCQTSSAYAKAMQVMQEVNLARGVQSPIYMLPTVMSPEGPAYPHEQMTPDRVKAQVWAMLIHESRGIVWFTQSPGGGDSNTCMSGDALADARTGRACVQTQVQAMGEVNAQVKALAPVLNTQSYVWKFGDGIDSMLKTYNGAAYIFAITQDAKTGARTFTLPAGITGTAVEVVNENRTIQVQGGKFTDNFPCECTHHVYKVAQ